MRRLAFAVAVFALSACTQSENMPATGGGAAATPAPPPAAAPAAMDTTMGGAMKGSDSAMKGAAPATKAP